METQERKSRKQHLLDQEKILGLKIPYQDRVENAMQEFSDQENRALLSELEAVKKRLELAEQFINVAIECDLDMKETPEYQAFINTERK